MKKSYFFSILRNSEFYGFFLCLAHQQAGATTRFCDTRAFYVAQSPKKILFTFACVFTNLLKRTSWRIPQRFEIYWKATRASRVSREWLSKAARFCEFLAPFLAHFFFCEDAGTPIHARNGRSRALNALSRSYAFFLLKCWFEPVFNPFPFEWVLRALVDFTLSNARRFYSSMGNLLDGKGLKEIIFLCFMIHWGVETTFLWVFFFKGMPSWLGFAMNCSSSVHQFPFFSCTNLSK